MSGRQIYFVITSDFGGIARGRGLLSDEGAGLPADGIGWVPANQAITPFDTIGPNPFGSIGDLRVIPDMNTYVTFALEHGDVRFAIGDIRTYDGEAWTCCPRACLRNALEQLKSVHGLTLKAAFEHEFTLASASGSLVKAAPAFSLEAFVHARPFLEALNHALEQAGIHAQLMLPEFGASQFEVPIAPTTGLRAADEAVLFREIVRIVAHEFGQRASFSPKPNLQGVGSGCHIHFSLNDLNGSPVNYEPNGTGNLSSVLAAFSAGVMKHINALTAISAPSVVSYLRLRPHSWSNAYACVGMQNREATLRICPAPSPTSDPFQSHHLEFRVADATSSPYMALAGLVYAGMDGIQSGSEAPTLANKDPEEMSPSQREAASIFPLPQSLSEALEHFETDDTLAAAFGPELMGAYKAMKEAEIAHVQHMCDEELCSAYLNVY